MLSQFMFTVVLPLLVVLAVMLFSFQVSGAMIEEKNRWLIERVALKYSNRAWGLLLILFVTIVVSKVFAL